MTDASTPSGGARRPPRPPRLGDSRAPATTIAVLAVAAVAVIAGFLILGSITEPSAGPDDAPTASATSVAAPATTVAPATTAAPTTSTTTTTTTTPVSRSDAIVVVANASGIGGTATAMTEALAAAGYTTAGVANSNGQQLDRSIIYFVEREPAALGVARLLAEQIPTANTVPMPATPPLDRPLGAATVALLLGTDAAGQPLAEPD